MSVNYVKFKRGSMAAYQALVKPDRNTLYFISDNKGINYLYLGENLVSGGNTADIGEFTLGQLANVIVDGAGENAFLVQDSEGNWRAKELTEVIDLIQNELEPTLEGDNASVEVQEGIIKLKDFGKKYYSYVPAVKDTEGNIIQASSYNLVDGFKEGLEPRVISKDGELIIAWYEPGTETVEDVAANVEAVSKVVEDLDNAVDVLDEILNTEGGLIDQVDELQNQVGQTADEAGNAATGLYAEIERLDKAIDDETERINKALDEKADAKDVYTKLEVNTLIAEVEHLKREIVDNLPTVEEADVNTIYMIPSGLQEDDNKYYEWIILDGKFERVGSWEVDLKEYAKVKDLENVQKEVDAVEEAIEGRLLSDDDKTKLEKLVLSDDGTVGISGTINASNVKELDTWLENNSAEYIKDLTDANLSEELSEKVNFITSVNNADFTVVNGQLSLNTTNGRLITNEEIKTLQAVAGGEFNNFVKSVNENIFSVVDGKLDLVALPSTLFTPVIGDMTKLVNYTEGTTIVNELNNIYGMLTWNEMDETAV